MFTMWRQARVGSSMCRTRRADGRPDASTWRRLCRSTSNTSCRLLQVFVVNVTLRSRADAVSLVKWSPGRRATMTGNILIYGASGYTGKLIARTARERGLKPILAGRNLEKVRAVAEPLDLPWRKFDLADNV